MGRSHIPPRKTRCRHRFAREMHVYLRAPHYRTAVQNPPYIYIYVPFVRPAGVQFGPAKGPFKRANVGPASNDSNVNNITLKTTTLVSRFS